MYEFKPVRHLHGKRDEKKIKKFKRGGKKVVDIYLTRESFRANSRKNSFSYYSNAIPWNVMEGFLFSKIGQPLSEVISEFAKRVNRKYLKKDEGGPAGVIKSYLDEYRHERFFSKTGFYESPDGTLQWRGNVDYESPGLFRCSLGPSHKADWNKQNIKLPGNLEYRDTLGCENPVFIGDLWTEPLYGKHRKSEIRPVYLVSSYKWCGKASRNKTFPKSLLQMQSWDRVSLVGIGTHIEIPIQRSWYYSYNFYWYYVVKKDEK